MHGLYRTFNDNTCSRQDLVHNETIQLFHQLNRAVFGGRTLLRTEIEASGTLTWNAFVNRARPTFIVKQIHEHVSKRQLFNLAGPVANIFICTTYSITFVGKHKYLLVGNTKALTK